MYQALYRKYRPLTFADVVGQSAVTKTLTGQLTGNKIGHAYLFTGTRGTGKTTCAKILARAVNCEHPVNGDPCNECPSCKGILDGSVTDVFEIDPASNNSVDNVRELREDVVYAPALVKYKVYIIDEVHRMSGPAFDALLKTIEEPPAHVIFILATTELHKVPATILSRCQRFDFRRIDATDIAERLKYVAEAEGISLSEEAALLLGRMGQGSMRDALSLLERATALQGQVDAAAVGELLGLCDPARMIAAVESIAAHDTAAVLRFLDEMWRSSKDISRLLSEMAVLLRDIALSDVAPDLVAATRSEEELRRMQAVGETMSKAGVLAAMETLQKGMRDIALSNDSRVMTEITLMRMCDPRLDISLSTLTGRIGKLEKWAKGVRAAGGATPAPSAAPASAAPKQTPPVQKPAPAKPAPKVEAQEAAVELPKDLWQSALGILRNENQYALVAALAEQTPRFEGTKVIFTADESSFLREVLGAEKNRELLVYALNRIKKLNYTIHLAKPEPPPYVRSGIDDIIDVAGSDAEIIG